MTADGFTYLRVGFTYDTYRAYVALFDNKFFAYTNGAFQEISTAVSFVSDSDVNSMLAGVFGSEFVS